jgi:hypothetical protein
MVDYKAERREDFMKNHADDDRRVRRALELTSGTGARLNVCGVLNAVAALHGAREAPPITAINAIRKMQKLAGRSASAHNAAHARYQQAESLDRLFPR